MNLRIKRGIKLHALEQKPHEACGFIYLENDSVQLSPCKNISPEPIEEFEIDSDDYLKCSRLGEIVGIYHSCDGAAFSEADINYSDEWPLPLYLYSTQYDVFKVYIPKNYKIDYIGRPFIWGYYDCYTLVKDYYRREYNIYLSEYDCDESYEGAKRDDIVLNFGTEGFIQSSDLKEVKKGDILLFRCGKEWHVGVYLGNNSFLHQPLRSQSRIETIDGYWAKNLKFILKHKSLI